MSRPSGARSTSSTRRRAKSQEDLLGEFGPGIGWDELSVLGPVDVRKREVEPKGFPYEVTIEEWVLTDRSDLVELSVKADPQDAEQARAAFRALLRQRGLDTEGDQQTKTRAALRSFTTGVGIS
jgi:hypothetical protein